MARFPIFSFLVLLYCKRLWAISTQTRWCAVEVTRRPSTFFAFHNVYVTFGERGGEFKSHKAIFTERFSVGRSYPRATHGRMYVAYSRRTWRTTMQFVFHCSRQAARPFPGVFRTRTRPHWDFSACDSARWFRRKTREAVPGDHVGTRRRAGRKCFPTTRRRAAATAAALCSLKSAPARFSSSSYYYYFFFFSYRTKWFRTRRKRHVINATRRNVSSCSGVDGGI